MNSFPLRVLSWCRSLVQPIKIRILVPALVICTLLITVGVIAGVGFRSSRDAMVELNTQHYLLAITEIRNQVRRTLESIILVIRELEAMFYRQLLPEYDARQLGLIFAERLRQQTEVDEICYTQMPDRDYVSANRRVPGQIIVRQALPGKKEDQTSEIITPTGNHVAFNDVVWNEPYDPRERPWFADIIQGGRKLTWVRPFQAFGRDFYCLGAGVSLFGKHNRLQGVLMVDASANDLREQLAVLLPRHKRLLFVLADDNWLVAQDSTIPAVSADLLRKHALDTVAWNRQFAKPNDLQVTSMILEGQRFEVAFADITLEGNFRCGVGLVIPEEPFQKLAKANLHSTVLAGLCALLLATLISVWVSNWLTLPLIQLSSSLERMGTFDVPDTPSPRSWIWEMAIVSEVVERLKVVLRSFGRYVPISIVRELIATNRNASRGGEECNITILFSELEMSTGNQVLHILQEYFGIATRVVEKEGSIDKFLGNGVLALFNEPRPVLCHVRAACLAALQWKKEWEQTAQKLQTSAKIRFGINTGIALVGNIGTRDRFSYTAMGDAVNVARRLLELACALDLFIVVGEETRLEASGPLEWRYLGTHQVAGRLGKIRVWELLGEEGGVAESILEARNEFERGLTAWNRGKRVEAVSYFRRASELRPSDCLTLFYLTDVTQKGNLIGN